MKCSLDISNFLEEISSFPFYCFPLFLCLEHWEGFLTLLDILWNSERKSQLLTIKFKLTYPETDILECEVKWALVSLWTKLVEVMEFQLSYFKSWKMMLWKCCTPCVSTFGKLSSGHRTGKGQFSFQSQRKAMPIALISHTSKVMLKILPVRLQQYMNHELNRCCSWI